MKKKQNIGVFIGRFQVPTPHAGHRHVLLQAANLTNKLIVLIGSANACPSIKNPWDIRYRMDEMHRFLKSAGVKNFEVFPLNDYIYSDSQWQTDVRQTIELATSPDDQIILFGNTKPDTNYLKWFPEWKYVEVNSTHVVSATDIRKAMFENCDPLLPTNIQEEYDYFQSEATKFKDYPYPETISFNCADMLVECAGHVLLIERKHTPGKGVFALPGGFKNRSEAFIDAAFRELFEETGIKVPEKVLRGSIVNKKLYDNPSRCNGIPRVTYVVHAKIDTNNDGSLPKLKASDDANKAVWVPLNIVLNDMKLFDDHLHIVSEMTGVVPVMASKKSV